VIILIAGWNFCMSILLGDGNMEQRYHVKLFACVSLSLCIFQTDAARRYQQCQDIIIDKVVVQKGLDDCQGRYEALKPILDRYKRPITVLDLGAGQGYFTFRIAHDYDSTCVMIEDNGGSLRRADQLLDLCHANAHLKNIALLNKRMSLQELEKLADCEHFDVVLAFDYIDHEACDWRQTVNAILRMGDNIFIQVPWSDISSDNKSQRKVVECLAERSGKLILQTPYVNDPKIQEQLLWFEGSKKGLRCKYFWLDPKDSNMDLFRIDSSYRSKTFIKNGHSSGVEWKKGINLMTFLMLNGTYPTKGAIKQAVAGRALEQLTDFAPWNLILQGEDVVLIDQKDKGWRVNVHKSLNFINEVIDQSSAQGILELLQHYRKLRVRKRS
jgi:hypothetical protein